VQFGWALQQIHRKTSEARLQLIHALAAFPGSTFLLQEFAALNAWPVIYVAIIKLPGSDLWAHFMEPKPDFIEESFDNFETYAAVRFRAPQKFLSEAEHDLLAAGMPPYAFVPSGEMSPQDNSASLEGIVMTHRMRHDLLLVQMLKEMGLLSESTARAAASAYQRVLTSAPPFDHYRVLPTEDQWHSLYPWFNRRLYVHPAPRVQQALRPLDASKNTLRFLQSGTCDGCNPFPSKAGDVLSNSSVLVIDELLTPEALASLRDFAELSTVWYQERPSFLGAGLASGFSSPLLSQIAEELRARLPELLCDLPLQNVWAFKFDDELETGIDLHADQDAVNVNFWITPDEDNLDESSGGLIIYDAAADPAGNMSFEDYNNVNGVRDDKSEESGVLSMLKASGYSNVTVPYRQNRAVIFDGARIHTTQPFSFRKGKLRSRRINITFLFGLRGAYCHLKRNAVHAVADAF